MSTIIEDGNGTGKKAQVDSSNRLEVSATVHPELHFNSKEDKLAFDFSTGDFISITSADTETGIFYMKNDSTTKSVVISTIRVCANQVHKVKVYKNPTGGTLISNATAGVVTNLNFTSSNTSDVTVYKGVEGATVSGTAFTQHISNKGHSLVTTGDALILGPKDSLSISMELDTAGDACIRLVGYIELL